jgi:thermitase
VRTAPPGADRYRVTFSRTALLIFVIAALAVAPSAAQAAEEVELIVRRDAGLTAAERADVRAGAGVAYEQRLRLADTELVSVPAGQAAEALAELRADPDVRWAMRNGEVSATAASGEDTLWPHLWGLHNIGQNIGQPGIADADMDIHEAWTQSTGGGVTVAVADSGVQFDHPDLAGRLATNPGEIAGNETDDDDNGYVDDWRGWDFVEGDNDPTDVHGHGTHVTGTIAAVNGNQEGVSGTAPDASVLTLRVLGNDGKGTWQAVADAFDLAGDMGIRVVNASLGGEGAVPLIADVANAHPNTLYVVAAGNDELNLETTTYSPCEAAAANVLCVGASDNRDARADFSNYGQTAVDLYAPGVYVASTTNDGGYAYMSGTSMATPNTAAVAALVLSQAPGLTAANVKARLMASTEARAGLISITGGRLNAYDAVTGGTPLPEPPPEDEPPAETAPTLPPLDSDGDGLADVGDECPSQSGPVALRGCAPVPALRLTAVAVRQAGGRVTVRVATSRAAAVRVLAQRKRCRRGRCAWRTVRSASVRGGTVGLRLGAGRYRLRIVASAGGSRPVTGYRTLTVRRAD